jgi:hypothetical protein
VTVTHHNIVGSEAFGARPTVQIRMLPRRRRTHPALKAYVLALAVGLGTGFADVAIDAPVTLPAALIALVAWRFWPTQR